MLLIPGSPSPDAPSPVTSTPLLNDSPKPPPPIVPDSFDLLSLFCCRAPGSGESSESCTDVVGVSVSGVSTIGVFGKVFTSSDTFSGAAGVVSDAVFNPVIAAGADVRGSCGGGGGLAVAKY